MPLPPGEPFGEKPEQVSAAQISTLYWATANLSYDDLGAGALPMDEYRRQCAEVRELELFMNSLEDMEIIADYPNLVDLSLHVQTLPRILGLNELRQLERVCITECGLESLQGLQHCTRLTHLDLSQNHIDEMDPNVLQHLTDLRTLWMNENRLTLIEGLEPLTKLSSLWLARNQILSLIHI